ncbi:hypothetical protein Tco_0677915 [Tanacetum coccineum]|uniref:Uncharacterized protein n=1 Tax=Tanacetum coccineum TaxID=301880 RepID=A0ABQ4XDT6_9ASTR
MVPVLTSTKIEQHQITEAQNLSLVKVVSAKEYKERQVAAIVQDAILTKEIEQLENPEEIEDDENDNDDHALIRKKKLGSSKTMNEQMQTLIPTPLDPSDLPSIMRQINDVLHEVVPKIVIVTTNGLMKDNLPIIVVEAVRTERAQTKAEVPSLTSQEFAAHAPKMIEELFKTYMQKKTKGSSSATVTTSSNPTSSSKPTTVQKSKIHALQPPIKAFNVWFTIQEIDDDENVSEEATTKFLAEIHGKKWVPTTTNLHKMKFAHKDILKSQCKTEAECEYHLQQIENYMNNQIVWEIRQEDITYQFPEKPTQVFQGYERDPNALTRYLYNRDLFFLKNGNTKARMYVLSLHKIHATSFPKNDLEEVLKRVLHHDVYGHEKIDEVCVKRDDDKIYSFTESDFKYLHKNDIEDMYYICLRRRNNPQQTTLIKALIVLIRS